MSWDNLDAAQLAAMDDVALRARLALYAIVAASHRRMQSPIYPEIATALDRIIAEYTRRPTLMRASA